MVIFGHSLGENDWQYFKPFFDQQVNYSDFRKKSITIFTQDFTSEEHVKGCLNRMIDGNLALLFNLNDFKIIKTECINEDQHKLHEFLIRHGKSKHSTEELIGNLLKKEQKQQ